MTRQRKEQEEKFRRDARQIPFQEKAFWNEFSENLWKRAPHVFRTPFQGKFCTGDQAFQIWLAAWEGFLETGTPTGIRFYKDRQHVLDFSPYHPRGSDGGFRGYLERLQEENGIGEFGVCLSRPQFVNPPLFQALLSFLDTLYQRTGILLGGCVPNLFFMNHKRSFFGLHKDSQDVFTFVLEGTRRFLLWPFDTFKDTLGANPIAPLESQLLHEIDIEPHRHRAVIIEAKAGDVIYWPAEWWHIGESEGDGATSLGLGVIRNGNIMEHHWRALMLAQEEGFDIDATLEHPRQRAPQATIGPHLAAIRNIQESAEFETKLECMLLNWATSGGLEDIPRPSTGKTPLKEDQIIVAVSQTSIGWLPRQGGKLLCSVAGRSFAWPDTPGVQSLFETLVQCQPIRVHDLLDRAGNENSPDTRDELMRLLTRAEQYHGIKRLSDD